MADGDDDAQHHGAGASCRAAARPELRDTAEWVQRNERLVPSRNLVGAGAAAFSQGIGVLLHIILDDCGGGKAPSDIADPRSGIGKPESDGPQRLR